MSDQKPIESGAEAKADAAADAKTIDSESSTAGKTRIFPLALHKPSPQSRRFALLAASLALAAALGGLAGSLSTSSLGAPKTDPAEPARNLQAALTQMTKDVGALKASIDAANRAATAQIAKLNDRFDRSERAQAEPAAKIAALTDTVSKLEKRIAANAEASRNDVTGSIPQRAAAPPVKDASKPPIVEGWVLREIYRGRALLERGDTLYEVMPGAELPGIGKVQTITRQDGRWVVVTPKGLIVSMR
jgi:hypothetical protein